MPSFKMPSQAQLMPLVVFTLIAMVIFAPLLRPGFIFALDMAFTPTIPWPQELKSSSVFYAVLHILSAAIPTDILQKTMLIGIVIAAGYGAYILTRQLRSDLPQWALYLSGVAYIFNPFVYSRYMVGQFAVLLGYALLPFFARTLWRFFAEPSLKKAFIASIWLTLISIVSIHTIGLAGILAIGIGALWVYRRRWQKQELQAIAKGIGILLISYVVLNSYWLVAALVGKGATQSIISFTAADFAAFTTNNEGLGTIGNLLTLQGFWADGVDLYLLPQHIFSWWWLPLIAVGTLVIVGAIKSFHHSRGLATALLLIGAISIVLACGTTGTIFAGANAWLVAHVPFFAGYREPQKFIALLALVYSYFAALGAATLVHYMRHKLIQHVTIAVFLVLVILCAPLMTWGFHGQLHARAYPAGWNEINDILKRNPEAKVIFLPWHMYMRFNFASKVIVNPATSFFSNEIIVSSNPEFRGARAHFSSPQQQTIETYILPAAQENAATFAPLLKEQGIKYVLLAKEFDYKKYSPLLQQPGFRLVAETTSLHLYAIDTNKETP